VSHKLSPETDSSTQQGELGLRGRLVFTVAWCSFLAASVATLVFFAFVDPAPIVAVLRPTDTLISRTALYSFGFFFFWLVSAVSAGLTASLLCTPPAPAPRR